MRAGRRDRRRPRVWLYRESTRELRLAAQRVSFVNQVSHELKTPLTNIRMYAELLEEHVADDDSDGRKRLGVVVTESQRLSRLINNILTFSRQDKGGLVRLHATPAVVDDVVADVLAQFAPGFGQRRDRQLRAGAPARVRVDADALAQILGNLLGNVEKYAPGGGWWSRHDRGPPPLTTITVEDSGPGIPGRRRRARLPAVRAPGRAPRTRACPAPASAWASRAIWPAGTAAICACCLAAGTPRRRRGQPGARFQLTPAQRSRVT